MSPAFNASNLDSCNARVSAGLWSQPCWRSGALLGACGGDEGHAAATPEPVATTDASLPPRPFQLGVSSLPVEASEDAYSDAFALAGRLGEVVLIQRAPPWADFVPGGSVSPRTERLTRLERDLAHRNDLRLLLAIDPTQPADRGHLAGLPDSLAGRDFSDKDVRASFIAYAKYLALNYKPAYMALGVEVDLYYARRGDAAFRNFVSVYFEAYDAVKEVSPNTLVFPTFQYENVLGILNRGAPSQPAWSLVDRFQPKLDLLAVSTFPRAAFAGISGDAGRLSTGSWRSRSTSRLCFSPPAGAPATLARRTRFRRSRSCTAFSPRRRS